VGDFLCSGFFVQALRDCTGLRRGFFCLGGSGVRGAYSKKLTAEPKWALSAWPVSLPTVGQRRGWDLVRSTLLR
jgi:hypothetical protein